MKRNEAARLANFFSSRLLITSPTDYHTLVEELEAGRLEEGLTNLFSRAFRSLSKDAPIVQQTEQVILSKKQYQEYEWLKELAQRMTK